MAARWRYDDNYKAGSTVFIFVSGDYQNRCPPKSVRQERLLYCQPKYGHWLPTSWSIMALWRPRNIKSGDNHKPRRNDTFIYQPTVMCPRGQPRAARESELRKVTTWPQLAWRHEGRMRKMNLTDVKLSWTLVGELLCQNCARNSSTLRQRRISEWIIYAAEDLVQSELAGRLSEESESSCMLKFLKQKVFFANSQIIFQLGKKIQPDIQGHNF